MNNKSQARPESNKDLNSTQNEHKRMDEEAKPRTPTTQDGSNGRSSGNLGTQGKGGSKSKN